MANKLSYFDSIAIKHCTFKTGKGILFDLAEEKDRKGYYNVEGFMFLNNNIINHDGQLVTLIQSGKNESTLGPIININGNQIYRYKYKGR